MIKVRNTKKTLLMSALSLLMCVSMLIGSTFAWFTDSVTSAGNKIQSGTLKLDLEMLDKEDGWASIKESKAPIFNYENWEPGYTDVKILKVENEGSLALKWMAKFVSEKELSILANVIDVYVCPSATELTYPAGRNLDGYTKVGTVADFVNTIEETTKGTLAAKEVAYLGIALKMQESAGNEYQDLNLGAFDIQIIATQDTVEEDSFDNQYDAGAEYTTTKTVVNTVDELNAAIKNANKGDVISIEPGVYEIADSPDEYGNAEPPFVITEENITIEAKDSNNKPVFEFITSDTGKITHGFDIRANDVTLKNLILKVTPDANGASSGNIVQISPNGSDYYENITIDGCDFSGSDHCIAMYGNNITIKNCKFDESNANDQGNIIYVWGTSGTLTITDNEFIGRNNHKHGISFYYQSAASKVSGEILIKNNTFKDVYKGIVHEPTGMKYCEGVTVEISNNKFTNCKKKPVAIDEGIFTSYTVNGNVFVDITEKDPLIDNNTIVNVTANGNYWDSSNPNFDILKNVTVNNYYSDNTKETLIEISASKEN